MNFSCHGLFTNETFCVPRLSSGLPLLPRFNEC